MIHRTQQNNLSGGPEKGRRVVQIGELFVEYSGVEPTQADLDEHLNPPVDERHARKAALREELLDSLALGETPAPDKIAEFERLKSELDREGE